MFTDRFIKVPIRLVDTKQSDLLGEDNIDFEPAIAHILPLEIEEYFPSTDSADNSPCVQVYFKSGRRCVVNQTISEFEKVLDDFGKAQDAGQLLRDIGNEVQIDRGFSD